MATHRQDGPSGAVAPTDARVREARALNASGARCFGSRQFNDAAISFAQAALICRATLGPDHIDTLIAAGNLALSTFCAGDRRKGLKLITDNLDGRARALGDAHPTTLTARNALAAALRRAGEPDDAVVLARQVVEQRSRVLGAFHADTLGSRMGLTLALAAAGSRHPAQQTFEAVLSDAEQHLGAEHEQVLVFVQCGRANGLTRRSGDVAPA